MRICATVTTIAILSASLVLQTGCTKKAAGGQNQMPPVRVIAVEAKMQPLSETLSQTATLAPNESVEIKAETDGIVEDIQFSEGLRVNKGQMLLKLDESKFAASVAESEANLKLSQANHERAKQLFHDKLISQQDFDQTASTFEVNQAALELKRRQLKDARLYAPFSGIVGARQVSPGQVISRNTILTWLVDLDTVKVEMKVPEKYLRQVQIGQTLEFAVAAYPNEKFRGEVYFISPQIEESTRTALVKARIANPDGKLRGGMFASLELTVQVRDAAIVIPEPALMSDGDRFSVFVVDEKGAAQMRPVEVGYRLPGKAEIVKGLSAGEKVVVEGIQKLRPGAPVTLAPPESAAPYTQS
ncbi:MAG: efflux RND transporter periplasmic adaptor subunit [Verrucomicrobia bacterium]|nr:efflux RND transporter periplasmic adaptor subunit [Verrucomicrobiota bacterium]